MLGSSAPASIAYPIADHGRDERDAASAASFSVRGAGGIGGAGALIGAGV